MSSVGGSGSPGMSPREVKAWLQQMDDEDFEYFVADLWERQGWTAEVSQKSRDKSLDVLVEKDAPYHQRHAIQAKRYQAKNRVGGPKISEYASLRDQFNADAAVVVTTSGFTNDAQERAKTLNVKLIDGDDLVRQVERLDALDLVEKYSRFSIDSGADESEEIEITEAPRRGQNSRFHLTDLPGVSIHRNWGRILAYSIPVFAVSFVITGLFPPESTEPPLSMFVGLVSLVFLGVMIVGSISFYMDMKKIRRSDLEWNPRPLYYFIITPFTYGLLLLYYFYKRGSLLGSWRESALDPIVDAEESDELDSSDE